ncbi:bifunctional folylpolyglutamate synthase/dihydrofolate synthase [Parasphingopyxis sp. CP4]|uniref:bifunctional folylpolyglutamate synthase/dihydrofolate synthase n=1 Tax=Parasphingopyxis sp. CP4 TaxID=2724527 RepID=UPI0015A2F7DA|nr:folylpolyglutamate synthase/dihydrofolate synthase family protein [Parasphingopyxis sp. CP4]QLC21378.1 bifunctional folylpolyglutamate synthase/dihydrofolate synthase [Parasphingopyxis sp. CP4]
MPDHARSDDPAVQRQLDRLALLSPGRDTLGLERITALLDRLGNPEASLPPVFHVAGTNGKGSTCAFLRAAIEAAGLKAHVYTSPHLVRFNERIRIAGTLIDDGELAALLAEVLDQAEGIDPSFFEATTAAALLAFSRTDADACVIEVGLGGRLDATNVIDRPLVTGIAHLGVDHEAFLGADIVGIAAEKAGIAKRGRPLITQEYDKPLADSIARIAAANGAEWIARGRDWRGAAYRGELHYRDHSKRLRLPLPKLPGDHQTDNALLALAMLSHQQTLDVPEGALRAAMGWAEWPARLQKLEPGPLIEAVAGTRDVWLDGGHNLLAANAIAAHFEDEDGLHLILGMLSNKDAEGFLRALPNLRSAIFVPVDGHASHDPDALVVIASNSGVSARSAADIPTAIAAFAERDFADNHPLLISGSLYLAGEILRLNDNIPD